MRLPVLSSNFSLFCEFCNIFLRVSSNQCHMIHLRFDRQRFSASKLYRCIRTAVLYLLHRIKHPLYHCCIHLVDRLFFQLIASKLNSKENKIKKWYKIYSLNKKTTVSCKVQLDLSENELSEINSSVRIF